MRAVWVALIACVACKSKKEEQVSPHAQASDERAVAREVEPPAPKPTGGLPEKGPHPDYPTAAAAGTDKIFFLEEPDRGPRAPASFTRPKNLAWTRMAFCETYEKTAPCTAGAGNWYVGRGKGVMIVERRRGELVATATVYVSDSSGAVTQKLELDAHGRVESALLYTQPGRYTGRERDGANSLNGCGIHAYREDAKHRLTEIACLQWLGDPMRDMDGVAVSKYTYDARGFYTEEKRFGIDGAPVDGTDGVHRTVLTRDSTGRIVLARWFSKAGERVMSSNGCSAAKYTYDAAGNVTSYACLDTADLPVADQDGVAMMTYRYDTAGCEIGRRYLDTKGANATNTYGVHGRDYTVNQHCESLSASCLGADERPRACSPGEPARKTFTRDALGRTVSVKHFDVAGAPARDGTYDAFELRYVFDANDQVTEGRCFDKEQKVVECDGMGFHGWRQEFDDAGREVAQTYFGTDGGPASNLGFVKRTFRYDNYDHEYETRGLGHDGKPLEANGLTTRRSLWDATHRKFAVLLYDIDGKPARYDACYAGATCPGVPWHAARINRRVDGTALTNQFFDAEGQLLETIDCTARPCFD